MAKKKEVEQEEVVVDRFDKLVELLAKHGIHFSEEEQEELESSPE